MLDKTKPGLLARAKVALEAAREIAVPADDIQAYPDQPRKFFSAASLQMLSHSIDTSGQTSSGIVRETPPARRGRPYELVDGERRWRAIGMILVERRPLYRARLIDADDDVVQYLISGIANFNREGHTPLETSDAINRMMALKLTLREIAPVLGVSEVWAGQIAGLRNLAPDVRAMLDPARPKAQRLPTLAAIEISKITGKGAAESQTNLAHRVLRREVTLVSLRGEVVKSAEKTGATVRTRVVPPRKKFTVLTDTVERTAATVRQARKLVADLGAAGFTRSKPELQRMRMCITEAEEGLAALRREMTSIAQKVQ